MDYSELTEKPEPADPLANKSDSARAPEACLVREKPKHRERGCSLAHDRVISDGCSGRPGAPDRTNRHRLRAETRSGWGSGKSAGMGNEGCEHQRVESTDFRRVAQ